LSLPQKKTGNLISCNKHTDFNQSETHKHKVKTFLEKNKTQGVSVH